MPEKYNTIIIGGGTAGLTPGNFTPPPKKNAPGGVKAPGGPRHIYFSPASMERMSACPIR